MKYEVERNVFQRRRNGRKQYFVKGVEPRKHEKTWLQEGGTKNRKDAVKCFQKANVFFLKKL